MFTFLAAVVIAFIGAKVGLDFPDLDQRTDILLHRSIMTHGPLAPLLAFWLAKRFDVGVIRWAAAGFCAGVVAHLAFDLFPRAWSGYALISIPVYGWLPQLHSWLWIAGSAMLSAFLGFFLARRRGEAYATFGTIALIWFYAARDERVFLGPGTACLIFALTGLAAISIAGVNHKARD